MHEAMEIKEIDVFSSDAEFHEHIQTCNARGTAAGGDDFDLGKLTIRELESVHHGCTDHNRGPVLIVMKNRNTHALAADLFHDEAIRCLDVFQVDRTEGRLQSANVLGELLRIHFIYFNVETIDMGKLLK